MWETITQRSHHLIQIFPFGARCNQYMLHGTATLGFGNGGETTIDWAARAEMTHGSDGLQMNYYQVYLVSCRFFRIHRQESILSYTQDSAATSSAS